LRVGSVPLEELELQLEAAAEGEDEGEDGVKDGGEDGAEGAPVVLRSITTIPKVLPFFTYFELASGVRVLGFGSKSFTIWFDVFSASSSCGKREMCGQMSKRF
jgi:hypothetical protein